MLGIWHSITAENPRHIVYRPPQPLSIIHNRQTMRPSVRNQNLLRVLFWVFNKAVDIVGKLRYPIMTSWRWQGFIVTGGRFQRHKWWTMERSWASVMFFVKGIVTKLLLKQLYSSSMSGSCLGIQLFDAGIWKLRRRGGKLVINLTLCCKLSLKMFFFRPKFSNLSLKLL